MRTRSALIVALLAGAAGSVAPSRAAAMSQQSAGRIDARIVGHFLMHGRITTAVNVRGERPGQQITRHWTMNDSACSGSDCRRVKLRRQRSDHIHNTLTLHRRGAGEYTGRSTFYAGLECANTDYKHGALVPYKIRVRVLAAEAIGTVDYATKIAATYTNRSRTDLTACPLGPSHDAATYTGVLISQPVPVSTPSSTAPPSISGNTTVGQRLTATPGTWTERPASYAYQWEDCNSAGASCTPITGATASSYTLQPSDIGATIVVQVTATNAAGRSAPASSSATAAVQPASAPVSITAPTIAGTATVGQTLTTTTGGWSGTPPLTYYYQWQLCTTAGANACANITGATTSTYMPATADQGQYIRVVVSAVNAAGFGRGISTTVGPVTPAGSTASTIKLGR